MAKLARFPAVLFGVFRDREKRSRLRKIVVHRRVVDNKVAKKAFSENPFRET